MALYHTYRPREFADVVGQDHIVTTLERAVALDRIAHAYLFCGTRGTGKTSVARILAKTILLRGIQESVSKAIRKDVEEGSCVDLIEIDAASNRRIDDMRDLIEKIGFGPTLGTSKVYIIDEVHMLTKEAFNALLKTLEEPPPYAYFILATTELHRVPETIQSRCQRFGFHRVRDEDIIQRLQFIADQEHISIDRDALRSIAHAANGSFRDGISLLDQLRSLEKITLNEVTDRTGGNVRVFVEAIEQALDTHDGAALQRAIQGVEDAGMLIEHVGEELLVHTEVLLQEALAKKGDIWPIVDRSDALLECLKRLRISPVPRLTLETSLIGLCIPRTAERVHGEYEAVIRENPTATITAAMKPTPKQVEHVDRTTGTIQAPLLSIEAVRSCWQEIVEKATPAALKMSLKNGSLRRVEGTTLYITFGSAFHRDRVRNEQASHAVEKLLHEVFHVPVRIECALDESGDRPEREQVDDMIDTKSGVKEIF